jgi:hypothetical protein
MGSGQRLSEFTQLISSSYLALVIVKEPVVAGYLLDLNPFCAIFVSKATRRKNLLLDINQ